MTPTNDFQPEDDPFERTGRRPLAKAPAQANEEATRPEGPTARTPVAWAHQLDSGFLAALAQVMTEGAQVRGIAHGNVSWKGHLRQNPADLYDHAMHHLLRANEGQWDGADPSQVRHHLTHAACNLMMWWWLTAPPVGGVRG